MAESIYTTQTPATDESDLDVARSLGLKFTTATAGQVTGGRWWAPTAGINATARWQLWRVSDSAKLAEFDLTTIGSPVLGGWNSFSITAVSLVTTETYIVSAYTIGTPSRFVYTNPGTFPLTNGNLTASTGMFRNGGTVNDIPNSTDPTYFFSDVLFAAGGGSIAPAGISVPVALGVPSATWSATAAPAGVGVGVQSGSPTLAWSSSIGPDGLSVPVSLGVPAVGIGSISPDGIAVPTAVGSPTLAWSATVDPIGIAVAVTLGAPGLGQPGQTVVRPFTGTVDRPNTGTVTRPDTGIIVRPSTGVVTRPDTGTAARP